MVLNGKKYTKIWWRFNKEDSDKGHILKVNVKYPKEVLFNKHKDLPILPEKIKTKLNGPEKLVCNISNKKTILFM